MNDVQENKLSMYIKVADFLDNNMAALASIAQVATIKTAVDDAIDDITTSEGLASADTTGFTQQKTEARNALTDITLKVSRATAAYYLSVDNPGGIKLSDYTPTELIRARDTEMYVKAKQLHAIAEPLGLDLANFNSGAADVTELDTRKEAYFDVLQLPQAKRGEKTASGQDVDELMEETDELLDELDIYLATFAAVDEYLYNQYLTARAIDDMTGGGGGTPDTTTITISGTVTEMGTGTPLENVSVTASAPGSISANTNTDATGLYSITFEDVPLGAEEDVTVEATLAGYTPSSTLQHVVAGESYSVDIELTPEA